ncbi:MAG: OsmC-like protein [Methanomassiliicoccales archaeon PtaU1.Bin030]|nr:MAG: OsmC-like protein [Methanomassiliicoccales archaeon PtaU1.Bin030]
MVKVQEEIKRYVNGVDVERIDELKASFNDDPDLASLRFSATNVWVDGAKSRTVVKGLFQNEKEIVHDAPFVLESDEPDVLLGKDTAPNAIVSLLHALASSLSVSIVYHAAMRGIDIDKLTISLEGDVDVHGFLGMSKEVRPGFQDLRVKVSLESGAPEDEISDLVRYAQTVSPILDSLRNRIPLDVEMA